MWRALAVSCLCLAAAVSPAAAEWHIAPTVGLTFSGNTTLVDLEQATEKTHKNIGGAVSLLGGGIFGVEAVTVFTPGFFQTGQQDLVKSSHTLALVGNVMVTTPRRWTEYSLRPFVSGGFGLLRASKTDAAGVFPGVHAGAFDVGGGAVGFFSKRTGVRFDLRYFSTLNRSDQ